MVANELRKSLVLSIGVLIALAALFLLPNAHATRTQSAQQKPSSSPTPRPPLNGSVPVVSPNGKEIAFLSDRTGGVDDVYVISVDGKNERQLTSTPEAEADLAWTREGKLMSSIFKDGLSHVYLMDRNGNNRREFAQVPGRAVRLSPDEQRLLYMGGSFTASKLTISAFDGSNPKEITDGSSIAWNSRWSPDGKVIAFTGRDDPKSEIAVFLINADGSSVRHLTHVPAAEGGAQSPRWSPDGKRLAFQVNSRTQKGSAHIWVFDLATGEARKLAPHTQSYLDETPSWFPDGKRLAFQSNRTGRMEIWVMNADGSAARQVTGKS
jgi:Tol biopolymer transport system component